MLNGLNYRHLYYFLICARSGRVTTAAKKLGLSQSALSLQLRSLEKSLGRALFNRTHAGLELTADGREVFDHCERIFAHGEALAAALKAGGPAKKTEIRLGVTSALGREVALELIERLAGVENATVTIYVGSREDIRERLVGRKLDIAVAGVDLSSALGAGYRGRRVGTMFLNFAAAPKLAKALAGFPAKGQEAPMLLRTLENSPRQEVERFLREHGVRARIVAESEDVDLLQTLARQGRGVVALHRAAMARDLDSGALVRLGPADTGIQHEIWVMTPTGSVNPALRKAIALANRP